jgi:hypothetical protein
MRRLVVGLALALLAWTADAQLPREPISELVRSEFYHGIPYGLIERYGREAVPELVIMLADERESEHWSNIVWCLGVLGGEQAEVALVDFVERRFVGELDPDAWRAVLVVPLALGFIAHDPGTRAFRYLAEGVSPTVWRGRGLAWTYPTLSGDERSTLMAKLSVNGLGVAGNAAAIARLEDLRERLPEADSELWRYLEDNIAEAVDLARYVQAVGHRRAFGGMAPRPLR